VAQEVKKPDREPPLPLGDGRGAVVVIPRVVCAALLFERKHCPATGAKPDSATPKTGRIFRRAVPEKQGRALFARRRLGLAFPERLAYARLVLGVVLSGSGCG
jgi:hypothetical protein